MIILHDTMIAVSGMNDVIRMYERTRDDGIDFNLASIGTDFNEWRRPRSIRDICASFLTTPMCGPSRDTPG